MAITKSRYEFYESALLLRRQELLERRTQRPKLRAVPTLEPASLDCLATSLFEEQVDAHDHCELTEVEKALERLRNDHYGHCEQCGETIQESRLQLLPATPLCFQCATALSTDYLRERKKAHDRQSFIDSYEALAARFDDDND